MIENKQRELVKIGLFHILDSLFKYLASVVFLLSFFPVRNLAELMTKLTPYQNETHVLALCTCNRLRTSYPTIHSHILMKSNLMRLVRTSMYMLCTGHSIYTYACSQNLYLISFSNFFPSLNL